MGGLEHFSVWRGDSVHAGVRVQGVRLALGPLNFEPSFFPCVLGIPIPFFRGIPVSMRGGN